MIWWYRGVVLISSVRMRNQRNHILNVRFRDNWIVVDRFRVRNPWQVLFWLVVVSWIWYHRLYYGLLLNMVIYLRLFWVLILYFVNLRRFVLRIAKCSLILLLEAHLVSINLRLFLRINHRINSGYQRCLYPIIMHLWVTILIIHLLNLGIFLKLHAVLGPRILILILLDLIVPRIINFILFRRLLLNVL